MKKILFLLGIAICLYLFAGCGNSASIPEEATKESITDASSGSGQPIEKNGSEPVSKETYNNFDGVTMSVKDNSVTSTGLVLEYINNTKHHCIYGEPFSLEKKTDESWNPVPVIIDGNYGFNSIGYNLDPNSTQEYTLDWEWLYGSLEKGEYRIAKDILDFRGTGDYDTYLLAGEFSIP
jgi:hypothetical protein